MARSLPPIVTKLCFMHDAWIVGSAAKEGVDPRDYDVIINFSRWAKAATLIPSSAKSNSFGGWTFQEENKEVDVWPGDLADFLTIGKVNVVWHPRSGKRYICR